MVKKKKFMAYLATVLLLIVSMIMTACGGPADMKRMLLNLVNKLRLQT